MSSSTDAPDAGTLTTAVRTGRMNRRAWLVTALLVLFQVIAFADKAVLGLVAGEAMPELGISAVEFGFIGSAFFFLYSVASFGVGMLSRRVSVTWILLAMGVFWAVMQFPMLVGGGAALLLVTRILLGGAEGPATAMSLASVHGWHAPANRALPSNLVAVGSALGPVVAAPALAWVIVAFGWRWAFGVLGIVGLAWAVAWLLLGSDGPFAGRRTAAATASEDRADAPAADATGVDAQRVVPIRALLLSGSFVAAVLGGFGNFWTQGFLTTWSPQYLSGVVGLSLGQVGVVSTLPWLFGAGLLLGLGMLGRTLMRRGASVRSGIAVPFGVAAAVAGVSFLLLPATDGALAVVLLTVAAGCSIIYPMLPSALAYAVAPQQRGLVMAVLGGVASIGAICSPFVIGVLMDTAGYRAPAAGQQRTAEMVANMATGLDHGFLLTGVVLLLAAIATLLFLRPDRTGRRLQERHTG
ncbi:MFS transporter [Pseudonocardia sp. RS11V-5]|uniref:MFS transporter n=1 Tax=Pseudonocardia terrae TaxID=2905831 RepID=UPI001E48BAE3|nr:MFS transporter [Pseudonocardia terrae]MCE3551228.1 MFS transporter [Pseudonocardia terrae]